MLRICLIVAIVMGVLTLGITQFKVATDMKDTKQSLADTQERLQTTENSLQASKRKETAATKAADEARRDLETTKETLLETAARADQQQKRADENWTKLEDTTRKLNDAQAELARWLAFNMTPQQIKDTIDQNKKLVADMGALNQENVVLDREVGRLRNELAKYQGEKVKVELPQGLKGQIVAVDPKYDFVVLNIGQDDGVLERGEMLVNRAGKLVAKVRIMSVQAKRSVANVLPEWKQADVVEGDQVVVGL
jgi:hypothetical protein